MKIIDKASWAGQPIEDRLNARQQIWIGLEPHNEFLQLLKEKVSDVEDSGLSKGVLLICESGGGKTRLALRIMEIYPTHRTLEGTERLAALMELPGTLSRPQLVKQLLKALGDPAWDDGKESDNLKRAHQMIKKIGLKILIIDNFQDIPERRDTGGVRKVGNWFRDLFDKVSVVIVAMGTEEARLVRLANDQVRRRIATEFEIPYFTINTMEDRRLWKSAMTILDKKLPMAELAGLSEGWMASRLFFACNGVLGYLFLVIDKAIQIAVKRGSEKIEAHDLELAYKKTVGKVPEGENPFSVDFKGDRLTKPGQYFYDMDPDRRPGRVPEEAVEPAEA